MNLFSSRQPKLPLFEGKNNGLVIATEGRVPGDCASPEPPPGFLTSGGPSGGLHKRSYASEQRRTAAREEQNSCCWGSDTDAAHLGARSVHPGSGLVPWAECQFAVWIQKRSSCRTSPGSVLPKRNSARVPQDQPTRQTEAQQGRDAGGLAARSCSQAEGYCRHPSCHPRSQHVHTEPRALHFSFQIKTTMSQAPHPEQGPLYY